MRYICVSHMYIYIYAYILCSFFTPFLYTFCLSFGFDLCDLLFLFLINTRETKLHINYEIL